MTLFHWFGFDSKISTVCCCSLQTISRRIHWANAYSWTRYRYIFLKPSSGYSSKINKQIRWTNSIQTICAQYFVAFTKIILRNNFLIGEFFLLQSARRLQRNQIIWKSEWKKNKKCNTQIQFKNCFILLGIGLVAIAKNVTSPRNGEAKTPKAQVKLKQSHLEFKYIQIHA